MQFSEKALMVCEKTERPESAMIRAVFLLLIMSVSQMGLIACKLSGDEWLKSEASEIGKDRSSRLARCARSELAS
jgi:hypothetical protein